VFSSIAIDANAGRGMFFGAIDDAKDVGGNNRDLPSGLNDARAASGACLTPATSRFNVYSAVSARWPRDVAAAIVVHCPPGMR
jgi:hypothetical protein